MNDNVLTITIAGKDDDIDVSAFLSIVRNTVSVLRGVEIHETSAPGKLRWVVLSVSKQSPLKMRMAGVEERGGGGFAPVVDSFLRGMRSLEEGSSRPDGFTDAMLDRAVGIVRPLNNSIARVVFSSESNDDVVAVSQHVAANADRFRLPEFYTEFGELEGELGQITVHKPPYEFAIYDPLTDKPIPCAFAESDLAEVRDLLKERVRVSGLITYKRRGDMPVSVTVDSWDLIPKDSALPSIEELHAASINLTSGRNSEEVIADLRRVYG